MNPAPIEVETMEAMRTAFRNSTRHPRSAAARHEPEAKAPVAAPESRVPVELSRDVVYGCSGAYGPDVSFTLRLPFVDETLDPPAPGQFHHEWILPRGELERAEEQGASDQLILDVRAGELRRFLRMIERTLGRQGAVLVRVGHDWVLQSTGG